jgi:hypothetical protein
MDRPCARIQKFVRDRGENRVAETISKMRGESYVLTIISFIYIVLPPF